MKFKNRLIRNKEGGVDIRLSFSFTKEEVKCLDHIPDDPNVSFKTLREFEGDQFQKVEWFFTWIRLICFWVTIGNSRETHMGMTMESMQRRKTALVKSKKRKRR